MHQHVVHVLTNLQGLRAWSRVHFGLSLPAPAANGHDIVGALRSGVAAVAAEAAPQSIVFVEDDWQVTLLRTYWPEPGCTVHANTPPHASERWGMLRVCSRQQLTLQAYR